MNNPMTIDNKATTQWDKSERSYINYRNYITSKVDRFELTLIDLLYISNFKGGNATINEDEPITKNKLKTYSKALKELETKFGTRRLVDLNEVELNNLTDEIKFLCSLTKKPADSKIDGFSVSYLSALLNCYFPDLLPILDRRILINLGIVKDSDINKQGQIIEIERFYKTLIVKMKEKSLQENKTLRQIDRELFIIKIPKMKRLTEN
jgi:hypothetical protein